MKNILFASAMALLIAAPAGVANAQQSGSGSDFKWEQEQTQSGGQAIQLSPSTIREVQQALNQNGYDVGNIDGIWGQNTQQAVTSFQRTAGLEPTGEPNFETLNKLGVNVTSGGGSGGSSGSSQQGGSQSGSQSQQGGGSSSGMGGSQSQQGQSGGGM